MSTDRKPFKGIGKVYTLSDKFGNVFYVGATVLEMKLRLQQHISEASAYFRGSQKSRKVQRIIDLDFEITTTIVELIPIDTEYSARWAQLNVMRPIENKWIKKFLADGCNLCNCLTRKKEKVLPPPEFVGQKILTPRKILDKDRALAEFHKSLESESA